MHILRENVRKMLDTYAPLAGDRAAVLRALDGRNGDAEHLAHDELMISPAADGDWAIGARAAGVTVADLAEHIESIAVEDTRP